MPNPLVQAIAAKERERLRSRNPFLKSSQALAQVPFMDTKHSFGENITAALLSGLGQGLLTGAGEHTVGRAQSRFGNALNSALLDEQGHLLPYAQQVKNFQGNKDLARYLPNLAVAEEGRQQDLVDYQKVLGTQLQAAALREQLANANSPETVFQERAKQGGLDPFAQRAYELSQSGVPLNIAFQQAAKEMKADGGFNVNAIENEAYSRIAKASPTKALLDVKPLYKSMLDLSSMDTRSADILLVSAFARINDPGSTVREGEVKISENAAPGFRKWMDNMKSFIFGSGKLSPKTRQEILEATQFKIRSFQNAYNDFAQRALDTASRRSRGMANPENILPYPIEQFTRPLTDSAPEQRLTPSQALKAARMR